MNEEENLLAELNGEETPAQEEDILNDTTIEPAAKETEEAGKEEKPLPFAKDPKVIKFIDKKVAEALAEREPKETEKFVREVAKDKDDEESLVGAFTAIIGNDTPEKIRTLKILDRTIKALQEKGSKGEEALEQLRAFQEAQAEESRASSQLSEGFESIREKFNIDLNSSKSVTTRNEFIDFIKLVAPKDENGDVTEYPDFDGTFKLFQDLKKTTATPNRAKELASRSLQRSGEANGSAAPKDYSWRGVEKMIAKLKNN